MAASPRYEGSVSSGCSVAGSSNNLSGEANFEQWCSVFRVCPDVEVARYPFSRALVDELSADRSGLPDLVDVSERALAAALRRLPDLRGAVSDSVLSEAAVLLYRLRLRASIVSDVADMIGAGEDSVFSKVIESGVEGIEQDKGWKFRSLWPEFAFAALSHVMADRVVYDAQEFSGLQEEVMQRAESIVSRAVVGAGKLSDLLGFDDSKKLLAVEVGAAVVVGRGTEGLFSLVAADADTWREKPAVSAGFYDFVVSGGVDYTEKGVLDFSNMLVAALPAVGGVAVVDGVAPLRPYEPGIDEVLRFESSGLSYGFPWVMRIASVLVASRLLMYRFGYCYLRAVPPAMRLAAARELQQRPRVKDVLRYLEENDIRFWCRSVAVVSGTSTLMHVVTEGVLPTTLWPGGLLAGESGRFVQFPKEPVAGAMRNSSILKRGGLAPPSRPSRGETLVSTYYDPEVFEALGPTFGFGRSEEKAVAVGSTANFSRSGSVDALRVDTGHKRSVSSSSFVEPRNLISPSADQATLRSLAQGFFEDLGVEAGVKLKPSVDFANVTVVGESASEWVGRHDLRRDTERMRDVEARMQSGSFLSKKYCKSVAARHGLGRARPELGPPRGRMLHVGGMYAPRVASSTLDWKIDRSLAVPGWTTYVFEFNAGEQAVVFVPPKSVARDIRMDWDGAETSLLLAGDVRVPAEATVIWFSYAIAITLIGSRSSVVRVSVPNTGMAEALGSGARRFSHMHEAVAVSDFDRLLAMDSTVVELKLRPRWRGAAGAARYYAKATYDSAANPYKIRLATREGGDLEAMVGDSTNQYAMIGFRSSAAGALTEVRVAGATFFPGRDGKVVVVTDQWNVGFHLKVSKMTTLKVSFVYITDPYAFEVNYVGLELETPT